MSAGAKAGGVSEPTKILFGLLVGAALGLSLNLALAPAEGAAASPAYQRVVWTADQIASPIGQVFLRMLFMVVVPLVFCSIMLGVAGMGSLEKIGRIGLRTVTWFVATTALAATLGLTMVNTFRPGEHIDRVKAEQLRAEFSSQAREKVSQGTQSTGFSLWTFVNIIPRNVVRSAADDRETLGVIFFALVFGIAATSLAREKIKLILDLLQTVYELCVVVLGFAMKLAPLGVAALIFAVTAKLGLEVMLAVLYYLLVALGGLVIHQFVVLGLIGKILVGIGPLEFIRRARTVMITAFSTSSSSATLPTSIRAAVDELGVPPKVAGFVLPLGATMNMNGTALFEGVVVLFLAQVAGVELSLVSQAIVVLLAVLTAIGAAGVPGGSLPLLAVVLAQVGVPPDMLALILGVDRLVDMTRTVPNVTSDLLCATYLSRQKDLDFG
jgi:DAACS family dicarboxylate/amino acid:cation (Na+ or H+) symporter